MSDAKTPDSWLPPYRPEINGANISFAPANNVVAPRSRRSCSLRGFAGDGVSVTVRRDEQQGGRAVGVVEVAQFRIRAKAGMNETDWLVALNRHDQALPIEEGPRINQVVKDGWRDGLNDRFDGGWLRQISAIAGGSLFKNGR